MKEFGKFLFLIKIIVLFVINLFKIFKFYSNSINFILFFLKILKKYTFFKNKYKSLYITNIKVTLGYENILTNTLETNKETD